MHLSPPPPSRLYRHNGSRTRLPTPAASSSSVRIWGELMGKRSEGGEGGEEIVKFHLRRGNAIRHERPQTETDGQVKGHQGDACGHPRPVTRFSHLSSSHPKKTFSRSKMSIFVRIKNSLRCWSKNAQAVSGLPFLRSVSVFDAVVPPLIPRRTIHPVERSSVSSVTPVTFIR